MFSYLGVLFLLHLWFLFNFPIMFFHKLEVLAFSDTMQYAQAKSLTFTIIHVYT